MLAVAWCWGCIAVCCSWCRVLMTTVCSACHITPCSHVPQALSLCIAVTNLIHPHLLVLLPTSPSPPPHSLCCFLPHTYLSPHPLTPISPAPPPPPMSPVVPPPCLCLPLCPASPPPSLPISHTHVTRDPTPSGSCLVRPAALQSCQLRASCWYCCPAAQAA